MRRDFRTEAKRRARNPVIFKERSACFIGHGVRAADRPSVDPPFSLAVRIRHVLMIRSSPVVTSCSVSLDAELNATPVTFFSPCGRSIRVFSAQKPDFASHRQILRYISARKDSSPSRLSTVAIHSPEGAMTARSTREGSTGFSSRRETRLDGETSSSAISLDVDGEYVWREDAWEEGRRRVEDVECTARGTGAVPLGDT